MQGVSEVFVVFVDKINGGLVFFEVTKAMPLFFDDFIRHVLHWTERGYRAAGIEHGDLGDDDDAFSGGKFNRIGLRHRYGPRIKLLHALASIVLKSMVLRVTFDGAPRADRGERHGLIDRPWTLCK
jgi:hypothetical protein